MLLYLQKKLIVMSLFDVESNQLEKLFDWNLEERLNSHVFLSLTTV